jgi:voltage-gated potassium channel Kch
MKLSVIENKDVLIKTLRELGLSYQETVDLLSGTLVEARNSKNLWRGKNYSSTSPLIKLGATVFLVPIPIVTETLGLILMSAGLFQSKVQSPPLKIDDIYVTCEQISRELNELLL